MIIDLAIGLTAGLLAGALFFGGLRWTLSRLTTTPRPTLLAAASFLVRTALVVAILLVTIDGRLVRAVSVLGGFVIVRTVLVARERRLLEKEVTTWT